MSTVKKIKYVFIGIAICLLVLLIYQLSKMLGISFAKEIDFFGAIEAVATIFSLVSIWIMIFQIYGEHEKGRREKTIDVLLEWAKSINQNTYAMKNLCERLTEDQCRKLSNLEEFSVSQDWYKDFCQIFYPDKEVDNELSKPQYPQSIFCEQCESGMKKSRLLTKDELSKLRWEVTNYLNILEFVLVAWENNVVDTEVVEQEFAFLLDKKEGKTLLEDFRRAVGDEYTYPAIKGFCIRIEDKHKNTILHRNKIDDNFRFK